MAPRAVSPVLVGRQEELSRLEDALLAVNRGDGRFVLLAGEAGIGKTRLATVLAHRARKLGCAVLWGGCSEAELALPYLPFVEALGNHLGEQDLAGLRAELGPAAGELAQLFPQLAGGRPTALVGDPAQAKLRRLSAGASSTPTGQVSGRSRSTRARRCSRHLALTPFTRRRRVRTKRAFRDASASTSRAAQRHAPSPGRPGSSRSKRATRRAIASLSRRRSVCRAQGPTQ